MNQSIEQASERSSRLCSLDGLIYIANEEVDGRWTMTKGYQFDAEDNGKNGFVKGIGIDGKGELYAITGDFTPDYSFQIGCI